MSDRENRSRPDADRRQLLKTTGVSLAALSGMASVGVAQPEETERENNLNVGAGDRVNEWFEKRGDKLALAISEDEYSSVSVDDVRRVPDEASRVPYKVPRLTTRALNEQISAGELTVTEESGGVDIERVGQTTDETGSEMSNPGTQTCNKSGYDVNNNVVYTKFEIYLSEGNIKDLNALFDIGAGVSAIADALATYGVLETSTPPGVGLAIAGVLYIEKGLINYFADGCGVKISIYFSSVPGTIAFQTVSSQ